MEGEKEHDNGFNMPDQTTEGMDLRRRSTVKEISQELNQVIEDMQKEKVNVDNPEVDSKPKKVKKLMMPSIFEEKNQENETPNLSGRRPSNLLKVPSIFDQNGEVDTNGLSKSARQSQKPLQMPAMFVATDGKEPTGEIEKSSSEDEGIAEKQPEQTTENAKAGDDLSEEPQPVEQDNQEKPDPTDLTEKKDDDIADSHENAAAPANQEELEKSLDIATKANDSKQKTQPILQNDRNAISKSALDGKSAPTEVSESAHVKTKQEKLVQKTTPPNMLTTGAIFIAASLTVLALAYFLI